MSRTEKTLAFVGSLVSGLCVVAILATAVVVLGRGLIWAWTSFSWEGVVVYAFALVGVPVALASALDDIGVPASRRGHRSAPPDQQDADPYA